VSGLVNVNFEHNKPIALAGKFKVLNSNFEA
jgi:hypothetical protein